MADSKITTNLDRTPYFDDYDEEKKFYRTLYKAGTPVQVRELNQTQTTLQRQISRFGSHVFRNGSIVNGVNPREVQNAYVVRIKNSYSNSSVVDVEQFQKYGNNLSLVSQSTGLEAKLITALDGSEANAPETKRLYVTYPTVDTSQTKTASGTISITNGSNTVTGTSTSFTLFEPGDVVTIFETPYRTKSSFNAVIESIANNTSMELSRELVFANTGIASNNWIVTDNITAFGQVGSDTSPELFDLVTLNVLNSQSNTVNTTVSSNTFLLDWTSSNTALIEVRVNGELQRQYVDYTPSVSGVSFYVPLSNGDQISIIEKEQTNIFTGLRCYSQSTGGIVTSEPAVVVSNEDGIVYHKGHFLNINEGYSVVSDNMVGANNAQVVVRTDETIVSYKSDESLLDNAAGFPNDTAPGADRLELKPTLDNANTANLVNQSAAAVILDFNERGEVRLINDDPQYAELGRQLAIRKDETAGNFTVDRFDVTTEASSNNSTFNIVVDSGTGYINGYRIETLAPTRLEVDRGISTEEFEDVEAVMTQGNVIRVHGLIGNFVPHYDLDFVYNTADGGPLGMYGNSAAFAAWDAESDANPPSGSTRVGRATVKSVEYVSGVPGSNSAVYDISVYNVTDDGAFANATSIAMRQDATSFGPASTAAADIVLDDERAILRNVDLLPFGDHGEDSIRRLTDSSGTTDNQWVARRHSGVSDTMNANGMIIIDIDDETDYTFNKSIGAYTADEINNLIVTNVGSSITTAGGACTPSGTTIALDSGDAAKLNVGDVVKIDAGDEAYITSIDRVASTCVVSKDLGTTAGTLYKVIPLGKNIPITPDMVTTDQVQNRLYVQVPTLSANFSSTTTITSSYEFNASDVKPATKAIKKDRYYVFDTGVLGASGPWQLGGAVDVHKVTGVYIFPTANGSFNESTLTGMRNYADGEFFAFDSGQRDFYYDYAQLELTSKGNQKNLFGANSTVVVKYDYFETSSPEGTGHFTIDSYPVTSDNTANNATILLEEVPTFIGSDNKQYDLRNLIDHRPVISPTVQDTLNDAITNRNLVTARQDSNEAGFPVTFANDTEYVTDYEIWKSRRVDVYLNTDASISVSESRNKNILAPVVQDGMRIASLGVNAQPSLTMMESFDLSNTKTGGRLADRRTIFKVDNKDIEVDQYNIRGYTMKDIGVLAQRIENLEYYASLNALEADIFNKQFKDANGLERFKNGIFVDPFVSHQFGQLSNPDYSASIDRDQGVLRPPYVEEIVQRMEPEVISGPLVRRNQKVMFDYAEQELIKQDKATKVRPAAPLAIRFNADVFLFPEYDVGASRSGGQTVNAANINVGTINTNEVNDPRIATIFGAWRTLPIGTTTDTSGTVTALSLAPNVGTTATGRQNEFVSSVTVSPFIREMPIGFSAYGLRPNTIHSVFFNRQNVDSQVAPGIAQPLATAAADLIGALSAASNTSSTSTVLDTSRDAFSVITPIGAVGTPIVSDSGGSAHGVFFVPSNTFLQGDRELLIADVDNLDVDRDAVLSSGSATFYSNRLDVAFRTAPRPVVRTITRTPPRRRGNRDPIAQTFYVGAESSENIPGTVFVSSMDLFFNRRGTNPVQVYLCPVVNGEPDGSRKIPGSSVRVQAADVATSADASLPTRFTFQYPIKLNRDESYAFVVKPDLDDPDFDVFFAALGDTDLLTGTGVNSQASIGVAFLGSNQDTWSALQDEDIKFTLNRAAFVTGTGEARFYPNQREFFNDYEDIEYLNNFNNIRVGDFAIGLTSANDNPDVTVANCNTSIFGIISEIDATNQNIVIEPSQGLLDTSAAKTFTTTYRDGTDVDVTKYKVAFYRPVDQRTEIGTLNQDRFVGSTYGVIDNHEFSTIVPQFTTDTFANNSINFDFVYNVSNSEFKTIGIPTEGEVEYTPQPLLFRSKTHDQRMVTTGVGNTSFVIDATMVNNTEYTSPIIDLRRSMVSLIGNLTTSPDTVSNNFITGVSVDDESTASVYSEMFQGAGESNIRYISEVVTLDEGQDAEDLKLFLTAFKPPRARIDVFVRAAHRFHDIESRPWTPLKLVNDTEYSARNNRNDTIELEYEMYSRSELDATEYANVFTATSDDYAYNYTGDYDAGANSMIATSDDTNVAYYDVGTDSFPEYKYFQVKVAMYATVDGLPGYGYRRSSNPPILHDIRAIALQI